MRKSLILSVFLVVCLLVVPAYADEAIKLIYPSEIESTIVDGRDFYVIAEVPEDAQSAVVRLKDADGKVVREITGGTQPQFFLEYENLNAFNTDQADYFMPDLVYDPDNPDSLWDASTKCYMKNGLLFAIVAGGRYRLDGRAFTDAEGNAYEPLAPGDYTLEIEVDGKQAQRAMTFATTPAKSMGRFTPAEHMNVLKPTADSLGIRTYTDPLPGYWSPSLIIPGQQDNPYFAEIKERWQMADAMEYLGGEINFFVYNLSASCATISVELARLQLDEAVESPRVICYHYDIGEPLLGYPEAETGAYLLGQFERFGAEDWLALTRAEVTDEGQEELYVAYEGAERPIDLRVTDGVSVPAGKALTLFGVVRPIQIAMSDMKQLTESAWEVNNRIAEIEYTFTCCGRTWTERKPVGINRMLAADWQSFSLFEFAHSFVFNAEHKGHIIVAQVRGYDEHGEAVKGTDEAFGILITE